MASITYITQEKPAGLAHAVKIAQPFLGDSPFVMYLGVILIKDDLEGFLTKFTLEELDALVLLREVENPSAFGVAKVARDGRLMELVEKPAVPPSNLALVGVYFFSPLIHQAIANIQPSARGELEITDAIQYLVARAANVQANQLSGWWLDTGKKDDLLEANRIILDSYLTTVVEGEVDAQSQVIGRVSIGAGSRLVNCTVRGPVTIGRDCYLENCFVGPYSSVSDGVTLIDTDIDHSVILQGAKVVNIHQRVVDSLIGQRACLGVAERRPKALRFMVGDDCQVELIGSV